MKLKVKLKILELFSGNGQAITKQLNEDSSLFVIESVKNPL